MTDAASRDPLGATSAPPTRRVRLHSGPQLDIMLGRRSLEELAGQLRPAACQTCLEPLSGAANLAGDAVISTAEVVISAHHPSCRDADLHPVKELPVVRSTAVARAWVLPADAPKGHLAGSVVVVVHPSCDRLIARKHHRLLKSRWVNVTLDDLRSLGFRPGGQKEPGALRGVTAELRGGTLTISAPTAHMTPITKIITDVKPASLDNTWVVPDLPGDVRDALDQSRQLTIAATMKVLPTDLSVGNVVAGVTTSTTLVGQAALSAPEPGDR